MYQESAFLQISGIQHFVFCQRQWALIHIEHQWAENLRTVEGSILHERAHDEASREARGDVLVVRGIGIHSSILGVTGKCDVVEFHRVEEGIRLEGHSGLWLPYPIEYKRGTAKTMDGDRLQLCCQAMCLEEMLGCIIEKGALFYGQTRRREEVSFSKELRESVWVNIGKMHQLLERGVTPKVRPSKACDECSLKENCLPKLLKTKSALEYLKNALKEPL